MQRDLIGAQPREWTIGKPFSEESYLAANPDVAEAVRQGSFKSGEEHFDLHGRYEGRRGGFDTIADTRPIFFCHIPKTAGTSVRMALEQAFAPHMILPDAYMMARRGGRYPPLAIFERSLSVQPNPVRLLRGHYPFSARSLLREPLTIAILRDPVPRSISELRHRISLGILDHDALIRSLDAGVYPGWSNRQVRFLSARFDQELVGEGPLQADRGSPPEKADLDVALRVLETIDVLGVVEDMPGFSARLKLATGVELPDERMNVGTVQIEFGAGHIEVIREHNLLDASLYERALELLGMAGAGSRA